MNKDLFEDIEVPSFEAKHAIKKGIQKGVQEQKKLKTRTRNKIIKVFLPIAAVITLTFSLGFVSKPIAQALSNIPIIGETLGEFYEEYASTRDGNADRLPDPEEITETSLVAVDQGITVEITGTYNYQNGTIGVFFEATGEDINEEEFFTNTPEGEEPEGEEGEVTVEVIEVTPTTMPPNGVDYYLFDNETYEEEFQGNYHTGGVELEEIDGTYVGNFEIFFEDEDYVETLDTIPLTFTWMCGKQGEWTFEIPVVEDPNTVDLDVEQSGHGLTIVYDSIYLGDTTSSLYYTLTADSSFGHGSFSIGTTTFDDGEFNGDIQLTFEDDKGEEIPLASLDIPYGGEEPIGTNTYRCQLTFASPIPADCEYLTVYVEAENQSGEKVTLDPVKLDIKP